MTKSQNLGDASRLSFFPPNIKSESDEMSTLVGMTRLVSRRSPSSPSYTSSPASQPASPPPIPSSQDGPRFADAVNPTHWQQYNPMQHHQQHPYQDHLGTSYQMQQDPQQVDISLMYNGHHMSMDSMPDYYGYPTHGPYQNTQLLPSPQGESPPQQQYLPVEAWHNFMAQYK